MSPISTRYADTVGAAHVSSIASEDPSINMLGATDPKHFGAWCQLGQNLAREQTTFLIIDKL